MYPCDLNNTQDIADKEPIIFCEFGDENRCEFSVSESEFCCSYIDAVNPFSNNSSPVISPVQQQYILRQFKHLNNIALSSVVISTIYFVGLICAVLFAWFKSISPYLNAYWPNIFGLYPILNLGFSISIVFIMGM